MIGSSSFGYPNVTGSILVPEPAAAITPVSTFIRLISIRGIWFGRRGVAMRKIASGFVAAQAINFSGTFPTNRKVRGEGLIHGGVGSGGYGSVIGAAAQAAFV